MISHIISHLLSINVEKSIDHWLVAGRNNAPVAVGDAFLLRFGTRFRIHAILTAAAFSLICLLAIWYHLFVAPLGFWLSLVYFLVFSPLAILSTYLAVGSLTSQVEITQSGLVKRHFGFITANITWESVTSVRCSPVTPAIIIETQFGKRVRVSTQMDGLLALAELLTETPRESRDTSIINWMIEDL